jgi:hypothetical protein
MVWFSADYAKNMNPQDFAQFLLGKIEGDKAEGASRSTQARDAMEAALAEGKGLNIMKMLGNLLSPMLNSLVPGLGSILGGAKGGGGKG